MMDIRFAFGRAIADLPEMPATKYNPIGPEAGEVISGILRKAEKFYLPTTADVLQGKRLDRSLRDMMRLPFPITAVLSETYFSDLKQPINTYKITLAFEIDDSILPPQMRKAIQEKFKGKDTEYSFYLFSILYLQEVKRWSYMPAIVAVWYGPYGSATAVDGINLQAMTLPGFDPEPFGLAKGDLAKNFTDDIGSVTNLMALLALRSTRKETISIPEKLQRARARRGKPPLYDYHILNVCGERWDGYESGIADGSGPGYRSHMRRGHIRMLEGRPIWVRAAFVHGRAEGFIAKDYEVGV